MGILRELPSLCGMGLKADRLAGSAIPTPSPINVEGPLPGRVYQLSGVGWSPVGDIPSHDHLDGKEVGVTFASTGRYGIQEIHWLTNY